MSNDHHYLLYGQTVRSQVAMALEEVPSQAVDQADVQVVFDGFEQRECSDPYASEHPPDAIGRVWKPADGGYRMLRYYNATGHMVQFLIREDGRQIRMSQSWPHWRDSVFLLMNPVMAGALVLGGSPVLHGSSMVQNGQSYFLMGESGAGKSSLSAALAAAGMMTHSDDIGVPVVLRNEGKVLMKPGYGQLKVASGLLEYIGLENARLDLIFGSQFAHEHPSNLRALSTHGVTSIHEHSTIPVVTEPDEQWLPASQLPGGFFRDRAPLAGIFVLSKRKADIEVPEVHPLRGMQAVLALAEHMYGRDWLQPACASHLDLCRQLAGSVPVWRVHMPDRLELLMNSARVLLHEYIHAAAD